MMYNVVKVSEGLSELDISRRAGALTWSTRVDTEIQPEVVDLTITGYISLQGWIARCGVRT